MHRQSKKTVMRDVFYHILKHPTLRHLIGPTLLAIFRKVAQMPIPEVEFFYGLLAESKTWNWKQVCNQITNLWYNFGHLDLMFFDGYSITSHRRCFFGPGDLLPVHLSMMELNCHVRIFPCGFRWLLWCPLQTIYVLFPLNKGGVSDITYQKIRPKEINSLSHVTLDFQNSMRNEAFPPPPLIVSLTSLLTSEILHPVDKSM